MGYFSNSSESCAYEARYCDRCVHSPLDPDAPGCAVWLLHLLYNYDQHDSADLKNVLDVLIPPTEDDLGNQQCSMFIERPNLPDPNQRCALEHWRDHGYRCGCAHGC